MAAADLIVESMLKVEDKALELSSLMDAFDGLAGDQGVPPWLVIVHREVRGMQAEVDALGILVRREALPHLRDLDRLHVNGGMGAVAPMVTQKVPGQLAPTRK